MASYCRAQWHPPVCALCRHLQCRKATRQASLPSPLPRRPAPNMVTAVSTVPRRPNSPNESSSGMAHPPTSKAERPCRHTHHHGWKDRPRSALGALATALPLSTTRPAETPESICFRLPSLISRRRRRGPSQMPRLVEHQNKLNTSSPVDAFRPCVTFLMCTTSRL